LRQGDFSAPHVHAVGDCCFFFFPHVPEHGLLLSDHLESEHSMYVDITIQVHAIQKSFSSFSL
jgi:hypothetical protein